MSKESPSKKGKRNFKNFLRDSVLHEGGTQREKKVRPEGGSATEGGKEGQMAYQETSRFLVEEKELCKTSFSDGARRECHDIIFWREISSRA